MTTPENYQRVRAALHRTHVDAVGIAEMIYWPETVARWHEEGLPAGVTPGAYFGTDVFGTSITPDLTLQLEPAVLFEDETYVLRRNGNGVEHKELKGSYAPPTEMGFLVHDRATWAEHKPLTAAQPSRLPADFRERYARERSNHCVVTFKNPEPWWASVKLLGYDRALNLLVEDPELVLDMLSTYTQLVIDVYEMLEGAGIQFDAAWFNGDLCYNRGMLFSPRTYRALLMPFHKRLCGYFKARRLPVCTHCCGLVHQLIPLYVEAGFDAFHPLESRVGNDVRELKKQYGTDVIFIGNISAGILGSSKAEIEEEIRAKVTAAKQGGGYIFHSDHSIPPSVSLDNYRFALEMAEKYGRY
ncbi:MAG: hypothetical protein FJX74_23890 [Armatimonadetes bacterium]|nr:hypothetical protein [Armatimonadota bacterium]